MRYAITKEQAERLKEYSEKIGDLALAMGFDDLLSGHQIPLEEVMKVITSMATLAASRLNNIVEKGWVEDPDSDIERDLKWLWEDDVD